MGVRADIVATARATVGHIIRFFSSSGVDVMPNRQYLDFAGNCTVNDDGTGIKVTIPDVPAGSVRVGQVETLPLDAPAYVTNTGTPTDAVLNFGFPVQGMTQAQIDAATQTAVSTVQGASQTAQTTLNSTVQSTIQTVNTSLASAQDALNVSRDQAIQNILTTGAEQVTLATQQAQASEASADRAEAAAELAEQLVNISPASDTYLGLTKLSDAVNSSRSAADGGMAATPKAVKTVNDAVNALDEAAVHIAGAETITGAKTFSETITGDLTGNADTATKLATARSLQTNLASSTAVTFDGSADQNAIPVTGTLPITNGGTGLTTSPSMLTNLASTSADNVLAASPRPGVTGVLPIANGGTGSATQNFVDLTTAQTVAGVKTFSSSPVVPTPAANDDSTKAATTEWVRDYVEAKLAEIYYWAKNAQG